MLTAVTQHSTLAELPDFCTLADLAPVLGISKATAYRMAEQGRIPCIRLGRRIVLSKNHLEQWIDHEVGFESNKEVIEHGETHQG